MKVKLSLMIALGMWMLLSAAYAQASGGGAKADPPPAAVAHPSSGENDSDLRSMVEAMMAARVSKQLGLNDEQTVLMMRRFSEFREELAALRKGRQEIVKALRASLKAGEPDAQIDAKLNELVAQDAKLADVKKTAYEKAGANLTVSQRAKLYVFLNDFESDMRRMIQKARERFAERLGQAGPPPPGAPDQAPPRGPGRLRQNIMKRLQQQPPAEQK